jgi:hypothetical protein
MERNAEPAVDQLADAAGRPEVGGEAVCGRLLGQPPPDLLILCGGQEPGPAWRGPGGQPVVASGPVPGHPLGDGDAVDAQGGGDRGLRAPAEDQLDGPPPHGFQFGSRSFASHGMEVT